MTKVYACILGNWFCLNDDPECTIIPGNISPEEWADTRTPLYAPYKRNKEHCWDQFPSLEFIYLGKYYTIPWIHIQLVSDDV
ncbi:MAG: hypothetical protein ACLUN8_00505 [Peptoniphilus grossensis]